MTKQLTHDGKDINYTFSLSQISHEISNPLTLIYSTIQLLALKHPELNKDELWSQLLSDVDYLKQLTVSLSSYNQCDHLTVAPTDIKCLLENLQTAWLPYSHQSQKQLIFKLPKHLPLIDCDSLKIKQCLMNLIKNSFEATNANDKIEVTAAFSFTNLILTISDTGKGLDKSQIKHIFEPFTTYKSGGSGLGLSITDKIIKAHHGKIHVVSVKGQGTRFIISLPIHQNK